MGEGLRDPPLIITTMARWVEFADDECIVPICLQVPARLLPLPALEYAGREAVSPQPGGDWKMDSRIHKLYRYGAQLRTVWAYCWYAPMQALFVVHRLKPEN